MTYTALNFDNLLGTAGFSDKLLTTHFKLYQGYVANTNKCAELLMQLFKDGKAKTPEFAEVKRRFGWEFNGMRLHELYFGNMSKDTKQLEDSSAFAATYGEVLGDAYTALGQVAEAQAVYQKVLLNPLAQGTVDQQLVQWKALDLPEAAVASKPVPAPAVEVIEPESEEVE